MRPLTFSYHRPRGDRRHFVAEVERTSSVSSLSGRLQGRRRTFHGAFLCSKPWQGIAAHEIGEKDAIVIRQCILSRFSSIVTPQFDVSSPDRIVYYRPATLGRGQQ